MTRFEMRDVFELTLKGTTTVAITCKDGVVMSTDTRAISGETFIAHKRVKKLIPIDEHVVTTIAGVVADAQSLMEILKVNARLYRLDVGRPMPIKSIATLASSLLFSSRMYPYIMQAIIGGVDDTGPRLFALDPFGSLTEETCFSTGSGSPIALGVLEDGYRKDMSIDEGISLVVKSIQSAMKRDSATGDDFDVAIVTKEGFRELTAEEKRERLRRIK